MSEKLSKDGLMDEIMLAMNSAVAIAHQQYPFRETRITQAREQIKSLIELSAQEPSDKHTSAILDELHEVRMDNSRLKELLDSYKYPGSSKSAGPSEEHIAVFPGIGAVKVKEPSEAEIERFITKWSSVLISSIGYPPKEQQSKIYHMAKFLTKMLKEYRELLGRG